MSPFWKWLLGFRQLPDDAGEGAWHLELQSWPSGLATVGLVLAGVAIMAGVWHLYRREGRSLELLPRLIMSGLRGLILVAVGLMLCDLVLVIERRERTPSELLVLVDTSDSMSLTDPYDDATARQLAAGLKGQRDVSPADLLTVRERSRLDLARLALTPSWEQLGIGRHVRVHAFDSRATLVDAADPLSKLTPKGTATAIGDALNQALAAHRGQPLAGVLIVSDGQSNGGEDPRKIAQQAGREGTLIQALVVGSEQGPSNARLTDLDVSPVVFVRDPIAITAVLESRGMQGRVGRVKLERRQVGDEWMEVAVTDVTLGEDGAIQRLPFSYTPDAVGQYEFRAKLIDAGQELTEDDNVAIKTMKVVRQRIRVLILAGAPSPEVQFMRNALLRDPVIDVASWVQTASDGYEQIGSRPVRRLPANAQELAFYDVVILVDPNMKKLGPDWDEMLTKFVGESGGGLVYIAGELHTHQLLEATGGSSTAADGTWIESLPVVWEPGLYRSTADVQLSARETWNLELTTDGNDDPIFRFAPDASKNREVLASLPGMYWHFPVTRAKPGATVLVQHGDQRMRNQFGRHVLMAIQRFGPGRSVFIAFDATYRWRYLHEQYFDGFWARLVDRAGRAKALGGRYPFTISTDKAIYRAGDRVQLRVQLTGAAEEITSLGALVCEVELTGGETIPLDLEAVGDQPNVLQGSFTAEKGGAYLARVASTAAAGEAGVRPATHPFRVEPPRQEVDKPGTNRPLLEEITKATGGRVFSIADAAEIPDSFRIHQVDRAIEYREELWDAPLWMLLIVLLLTSEWVIRKLYRLA